MTSDVNEFLAYRTNLNSKHRDLNRRIERISKMLKGALRSGNDEITLELKLLRQELGEHFCEEELGGCLDEAVSRQPGLGRVHDQLRQEHPNLLSEIERMIESLVESPKSSMQRTVANAAFHRFIEHFRNHETSESQLLEHGFGVFLQ